MLKPLPSGKHAKTVSDKPCSPAANLQSSSQRHFFLAVFPQCGQNCLKLGFTFEGFDNPPLLHMRQGKPVVLLHEHKLCNNTLCDLSLPAVPLTSRESILAWCTCCLKYLVIRNYCHPRLCAWIKSNNHDSS